MPYLLKYCGYFVDEEHDKRINFIKSDSATYCIALYDYESNEKEELSLQEGQVIRILRKIIDGIDDGWWEGEVDGKIGLFPSLMVQDCTEDGRPLTFDDVSSG